VRDVVSAHITFKKFTDIKVDGSTTIYKVKGSSIKTVIYFSKEYLCRVRSMVKVNIFIKIMIILREIILEIREEDLVNIIFLKGEYYNRNLIPILHKNLRFNFLMDRYIMGNS
jgi:hypothetical protein